MERNGKDMMKPDMITCEHTECAEKVHHEQAHSCLIVLQKVDKEGYYYFQCEQGQTMHYHNYQHWHCSHKHMKSGVIECIDSHYKEIDLHKPESGTTRLHKMVLNGQPCEICSESLVNQAYRFCITPATPVNYELHDHTAILGGWCCSLDHAKGLANEYISRLQ
jgi:hypothetical protein